LIGSQVRFSTQKRVIRFVTAASALKVEHTRPIRKTDELIIALGVACTES
jgi:hypothetical protein